ncbi:MAG TPA: hypothetical protein VJ890_04605 [Vineibacter sp.]|nr:hypothetical protein [Vineibacter sp.]
MTVWAALALLAPAARAEQKPIVVRLHHPGENQIPAAITEVRLMTAHTEVVVTALRRAEQVCWTESGPDAPYLLSGGKRFRFLGGDNIKSCPARQSYRANDVMVLRFVPLDGDYPELSLVEGEGGEKQALDPSSSRIRYWNFLRIRFDGAKPATR